MKVFLVLLFLYVAGQSSAVTLYRETSPGVWITENVTNSIPNLQISDDDVKIYFRNRDSGLNIFVVDVNDTQNVNNVGFSPEKDTMFIIHGWQNDLNSQLAEVVGNASLIAKDINVFVIDWSKIAKLDYLIARAAVPGVGKVVGELINSLIDNNNLTLDTTILVGHSLGAHISGIVGAKLGGEISSIVGLDPAFPLFIFSDKDDRLDSSDAKFVEVIHTCSGLLGYNVPLGHADYWPNGGTIQPGCELDVTGSCAHGRSYLYYAESLISGGFISKKCDSYVNFILNLCGKRELSVMGEYNLNIHAAGNYYLTTHNEPPYAKN